MKQIKTLQERWNRPHEVVLVDALHKHTTQWEFATFKEAVGFLVAQKDNRAISKASMPIATDEVLARDETKAPLNALTIDFQTLIARLTGVTKP